jgi:hypothetical protein
VLHRLFHLGFARSHQREPIMSAGFPRTSVSRISPVSGLGWRSAARRLNASAGRTARDAPHGKAVPVRPSYEASF